MIDQWMLLVKAIWSDFCIKYVKEATNFLLVDMLHDTDMNTHRKLVHACHGDFDERPYRQVEVP